MEYSWCDYFQKAYEREKKKNIVLAGKVADAETKREELQGKYEAICANPLYKMSRVPSLFVRGLKKVWHVGDIFQQGVKEEQAPEEFARAYRERLHCQQDSYGQWIREAEDALWGRYQNVLSTGKTKKQPVCLVIPYGSFAGATSLAGMAENAAGMNLSRSAAEAAGNEVEIRPDILLFAEYPEQLDERAVSLVEQWFGAFPETKFLYGAQDQRPGGKRCFPWFKPCLSPDTLLGFFYFGSYFAVDRAWAERVSLSGYEEARSNLYDFVLRLLRPYFEKPEAVSYDKDAPWGSGFYYGEKAGQTSREKACPEIVCLDLVLYHQDSQADFTVPADLHYYLDTGRMRAEANPEFWGFEKKYIKLKQDFINGIGYECESCQTLYPEIWSVRPAFASQEKENMPVLSVIILSKDHPELLQKCIGSFLERTCLEGMEGRVQFIVVDNGSCPENRQAVQDFLGTVKAQCCYIYHPMAFNFSAMCNLGEKAAEGEYILLLNDDVEVIEADWLRIMLGQAMLSGTGAVGAKLWYPEGEVIQHAGVTNMHIGPSHKMTIFPDDRVYYYGHNTITYDMIAVTAACLLVKRSLYEEVGGLDEEMAVSYNDVDFCFKLAEAGYRNVLRNDAVLLHHESASRGADDISEEKWQRLIGEKTKLYQKHPLFHKYDPYYSEQLIDNASDYRIGYRYPYDRLLLTATPERKEKKTDLQAKLSAAVMLTVERAGEQKKIYLYEPDILETEGWCYMLGRDNCLYERWLILEAQNGDFYYQIPVKERLRPDVEAILPMQKNVELSGFTCRILKEHLDSGSYTVGMLYRDLRDGKPAYGRSGKLVRV